MWEYLLNILPLRLSGKQSKFVLKFYGQPCVFALKFRSDLNYYTIFMKMLRDMLENLSLENKSLEKLFYDFISHYF